MSQRQMESENVHNNIKTSNLYWKMKRSAKNSPLALSTVDVHNISPSTLDQLIPCYLLDKVKNIVWDVKNKNENFNHMELQCVRDVKERWELSLCEELVAVARENNQPVVCRRNDLPISTSTGSSLRFLYDNDDFLDVITGISSNNVKSLDTCCLWGLINLQLYSLSLSDLQILYHDLNPIYQQIGLDDTFYDGSKFLNDRVKVGLKLLKSSFIPGLRDYSKRGVPPSLRPQIWRKISGLDEYLNKKEINYYNLLKKHYDEWHYVTDDLYKLDVVQTCADDNYFPFEEIIQDIMLVWSRDIWTLSQCNTSVFIGMDDGGLETDISVPPCGVQPFRGLSYLVAPLAYVYPDPISAYQVYRFMYSTLWYRLSTLNTDDNCLLSICRMFEDLLQLYQPHLVLHCKSIGVYPLSIAFPWIRKAFSGYLPVDQVLILWDRLLAYNNLYLLSVLSAAIFIFRSSDIMSCTNIEEVNDCFQDTARLKIIPLIQHFIHIGPII